MPSWSGVGDLTTNNLPNFGGVGQQRYRPTNVVNSYIPGIALALAPVDSQCFPDFQSVRPVPAGTTSSKFVGVVAPGFLGFDGNGTLTSPLIGNASYSSPSSQTNLRGTEYIKAQIKGVAYCLVDQSGSGAVTITDGIPIVSSRNTAGYGQGVALATATNAQAQFGLANLPGSGIGSSLTAAALAQASQFSTIATPASGDVLNLTIQSPYTDLQPGTLQTTTWSLTLNSTTAASATTAGAAMVAFLNAQPSYSQFFTASAVAGAVTTTVNALATSFLVTGGTTNSSGTAQEQWRFFTNISGMASNSLTYASTVTGAGGTTFAANAANLAGGTGFIGRIPIIVNGEF